jgi:hypothetical protein
MIQNIRDVLELAFYCSGIALAICAVLGLGQLRIAKESVEAATDIAKMSARREAFRLAAEQSLYYYKEIIPLFDACYHYAHENNLVSIRDSLRVELTSGGLGLIVVNEELSKKYNSFTDTPNLLPLANLLEGFAVLFTSGVASEMTAFSSIGHTFCESIQSIAPFLLMYSRKTHYQHVLKLFYIWSQRIEHDKLVDTQRDIQKRIAETQRAGIKLIGT